MSPSGYGVMDMIFNYTLHELRNVGFFRALTVEFGGRLKTRRMESTETRIILGIIIYCLKIFVRRLHQ